MDHKYSGALGGAASGALAGSALGPYGAIGGGILGGALGFFGGSAQDDADEERHRAMEEAQKRLADLQSKIMQQRAAAQAQAMGYFAPAQETLSRLTGAQFPTPQSGGMGYFGYAPPASPQPRAASPALSTAAWRR